MTSKLTREEMQELISALRLTPTSTVNGISLGRVANALSESVTAMGSQPVAWDYEWASCITCEGPQGFKRVIEREAPPEWSIEEGRARNVIPLYRRARQPVEMDEPSAEDYREMDDEAYREDCAYAAGWNACRAAMLQPQATDSGD